MRILLTLLVLGGILSAGCGSGAVDTADAGTPNVVAPTKGNGSVPNAGQKGGIQPPGI